VRWDVRENERHPLPSRHGKVAARGQPLAPKLYWRAEEQHVRAIARRSPVSLRVTHGTQLPYPNRTINSVRIGTVPLADYQTHELGPGHPPCKGMKSIRTTAPRRQTW
jgi:hypothetical protein